jgi:hypothetical protein
MPDCGWRFDSQSDEVTVFVGVGVREATVSPSPSVRERPAGFTAWPSVPLQRSV